MKPTVTLRPYTASDATTLLALFRKTVYKINRRDYTPQQIDAWAAETIDRDAWSSRFGGRFAYVAELDGHAVGFADMSPDGYLDRLFVSADHQRQGIGKMLLQVLIARGQETELQQIWTDASITARHFFEAAGFIVLKQQRVECRGMTFINYRMTLKIDSTG